MDVIMNLDRHSLNIYKTGSHLQITQIIFIWGNKGVIQQKPIIYVYM